MNTEFWTMTANILVATFRMATPLILSSLGLVYTARAGMSNLGTEGLMLIGAFVAAVGSFLTGSALLGVLMAIAGGILMELIVSFLAINVRANQIIVAMATNLLAQGVTSIFGRAIFGISGEKITIPMLQNIAIPWLSKLPIIGDELFNNNILFYLAYLLLPVSAFILTRTTIGLKVRVVGENPKAADTVGVNVYTVRRCCCLARGAFAALAGAYLALGVIGVFSENMIAGKGYMSVSVTIFGKWMPLGSLLGALLFGFGETLQLRIQAIGWTIPYQALQAFPYLITLILLTGVVGRTRQPAATGKPYIKD